MGLLQYLGLRKRDGLPFSTVSMRNIGVSGEEWISTAKEYKTLIDVPRLYTILKKKALLHANVCWEIVDKDGKVVPPDDKRFKELYALLERPNPAQRQNKFIIQRRMQLDLYGNQFIYKNKPSMLSDYPKAIWNISPKYMAPVLTGKVFDQLDINEIVSGYKYDDGKTQKKYESKDILYSANPDIDDPVIGVSPLVYITKELTMLRAAWKYKHKAVASSGSLGMISADAGGKGEGAVPLLKKEKERIVKEHLNTYGIEDHQLALFITEASLKYTSMAPPLKDMMIPEVIDINFMAVCDHYGMNSNIFSNKGTKFDDLKQTVVGIYQDTIVPEAEVDGQDFTGFLMTEKDIADGFKIRPSVEHISILKENKKEGMEALNYMASALSDAVQSGIIQPAQATAALQAELPSIGLT